MKTSEASRKIDQLRAQCEDVYKLVRNCAKLEGDVTKIRDSYQDYDNVDAIRASYVREYIKSPYGFHNIKDKPETGKEGLLVGSEVHLYLEESHGVESIEKFLERRNEELLAENLKKNPKSKVKIAIKKDLKEDITNAIMGLTRDRRFLSEYQFAKEMKDVENSYYFKVKIYEDSIDLKTRIDFIKKEEDGDVEFVYNLKTARDIPANLVEEEVNELSKRIINYNYHHQMCFSLLPFILKKYDTPPLFAFYFVSKEFPYETVRVFPSANFISVGFFGGARTGSYGLINILEAIIDRKKKKYFPRKYEGKDAFLFPPTWF